MERVAVITDIHANMPALEAVLDAIEWIDVDAVYCGGAYRDQHDRELGQLSVAWTLEHTDPHSKDFMRGLPFDLRFELGGRRVRLVHGSPRKVNEYLFADKPARTFERIAAGADCDVLVFGHPRAAFAVLELEEGGVVADIERVEYDVARVAREVEDAGLPGEYAEN